jgi:hypothetical protein
MVAIIVVTTMFACFHTLLVGPIGPIIMPMATTFVAGITVIVFNVARHVNARRVVVRVYRYWLVIYRCTDRQ